MEPAQPRFLRRLPRAPGLWPGSSGPGLRWRLLAGALSCCTVLALYAASVPWERAPLWGGGGGGAEDEGNESQPVTVVMWWKPFGSRRQWPECERRFGIRACTLTTDRGRHLKAQAVVFHHRNLLARGLKQLPQVRPSGQRWVWMNMESPTHTRGLRGLAGVFNWTMTYRADSDVFVPYGYLHPRHTPKPAHLSSVPRKTKLAAWVVSNWNERHARVRYYRQLKKYLPIDVYGAHNLKLKNNSVVETVSKYKFYLAFENSQHRDYITEKLWRNAFASWAVPVVLGPARSNYELFVPSDSFIHIDDFAGPRELALYLKSLDKNNSRYLSYFAWRKRYDVHVMKFWEEHGCRVCNAVRTAGKQPKIIQDLAKWFRS